MLRATNGKTSFGMAACIALSLLASSCDSGDTDAGPANDNLGPQNQYVSDGGAGGALRISVKGSISVGEQTPFSVIATDPNGEPLPFIRIFCESERGLAIIEPSSGGVAFESTSSDGSMSGVLGGVTPGSFLLECRGPQGFNLVARETVSIGGSVPDGFTGFPGAAGGNLGGGVIIDQSDDSVVVSAITFSAVTGPSSHIDTSFDPDCNNDGLNEDPEPFGFDDYIVTVQNNLTTSITIETVRLTVLDGRPGQTSTQTVGVPLEAGGEAQVQGPFTEFTLGPKNYAGSGQVLTNGTYNVQARVQYRTSNGERATIQGRTVITIGGVDNCAAS